jgi:hypothetical protein
MTAHAHRRAVRSRLWRSDRRFVFGRGSVVKALLPAVLGILAAAAVAAPVGAVPTGGNGSTAPIPAGGGQSYSMLTSTGALLAFGAAFGASASGSLTNDSVAVAGTADGQGAYVVEADGFVFVRGDARWHGGVVKGTLAGTVVGIAADTKTGGYWVATSSGVVYPFGAPKYGDVSKIHLKRPIVGISSVVGGGGYRLVASDGGVFSFGDARFKGSTGKLRLKKPIVGMATTDDGGGYWLVAADGGIFAFGDAHFFGSTGHKVLNKPVVGMAATNDGGGYWLAASDGGVFCFGDARFFGSAATAGQTIVGIVFETGGYVNPLRAIKNLAPERVDQGVDYGGSGPIYAIGDGVVLNTTNSGWPGGAFITYQLLDGRAKGDIVYVAENVQPMVRIGQEVTPATVLGILRPAYPNLETGWADPPGNGETLARASGQWNAYDDAHNIPTAYGENFSQLLAALGELPGTSHAKPTGKIPANWPRWSRG